MNFRGAHTPLQPFNSLPSEAERRRNMTKVTSGASLVSFSLLRSRWKKIQQQEGSAMATLIRQLPNPDTFLCKPWSTFISAAKLHYSDSKCKSNVVIHFYKNGTCEQCWVVLHASVKTETYLASYQMHNKSIKLMFTNARYSIDAFSICS
jgi:hypothetical protein